MFDSLLQSQTRLFYVSVQQKELIFFHICASRGKRRLRAVLSAPK